MEIPMLGLEAESGDVSFALPILPRILPILRSTDDPSVSPLLYQSFPVSQIWPESLFGGGLFISRCLLFPISSTISAFKGSQASCRCTHRMNGVRRGDR